MKAKYVLPAKSVEATYVVSEQIQDNRGKFRGRRCDGSSGPHAKRQRMDYETREREGERTYKHTASRTTGDYMAALLLAFHTVAKPLAKERCSLNPKTGRHLESIEDSKKKFVPNNMKYLSKLFRTLLGDDVIDSQWFQLHRVKRVIGFMLVEVCKQERGRWKWRGFFFHKREKVELHFKILQAFLAGADACRD